jgi:hypothetical protein
MRVPVARSAGQDVLGVQHLDADSCGWRTVSLEGALGAIGGDSGWPLPTDALLNDLEFTADQRVVFADDGNAYTFVGTRLWPDFEGPVLAFSKDDAATWVGPERPTRRFAEVSGGIDIVETCQA